MTARTPELTEALSRVNEEEVGRSGADAPPLSHPFGTEPVPVSGKAGIANAGFTPGPWRNIRAIRKVVAELGFGPPSQQEANAHLTAAAPDLYEALDRLLAVAEMTTFSDQYPRECEQAHAALRKARGEQP